MSPISKPVEYFPVYLFEQNKVIIHPQTISDSVKASYIKKPANPSWNFDSSSGYYVWDPATSVNFELDATEQVNVIIQILLYAGIVIKDPTIVQAAASEIAQEAQNERN
jgi:hypothetical protein